MTTDERPTNHPDLAASAPGTPSRRRVLQAAGLAGAGAAVLAACGTSSSAGTSTAPAATTSGPTPDPTTPAPTTTSAPAAGGGGITLGPASDVSVGGGKIYKTEQVVVTQPTAGQFKAFSAVCPHQGCIVATVTDTINCACHGSAFALADGARLSGPAPAGLAPTTVTDTGGTLTVPKA